MNKNHILLFIAIFLNTAHVYAQDGLAPTVTLKSVNSETIALYEKFEITINLENASYSNPYDPDQIDLRATFTAVPQRLNIKRNNIAISLPGGDTAGQWEFGKS
jgi:hypothetical protein